MIRQAARFSFGPCIIALTALTLAQPAQAQRNASPTTTLPSIEEKTEGLERMDGMLPLYWDAAQGQLWMEIPALGVEMIHFVGYGAGLGSNDLGLDRGAAWLPNREVRAGGSESDDGPAELPIPCEQ